MVCNPFALRVTGLFELRPLQLTMSGLCEPSPPKLYDVCEHRPLHCAVTGPFEPQTLHSTILDSAGFNLITLQYLDSESLNPYILQSLDSLEPMSLNPSFYNVRVLWLYPFTLQCCVGTL
jgi:hypothetical protein